MEYCTSFKVVRWLLLLTCFNSVCPTSLEEDCIWRGSGVPRQERPSVVSIETKCHQGELHWSDPFGGLRVTFNPRDVHADYKLCFTARHPGVRIYIEWGQNLTLLRGTEENETRSAVCVKSSAAQRPVLYLETQEDQIMTQLNYTVLVNGRKRPIHKRRKECKPCHYRELLRSFCEANFVVRGYIRRLIPVGNGLTEQADFEATEIIRQEHEIFVKRDANKFAGSINVPGGCHWRETKNQLLLLTGNLKGGKGPALQCYIQEEAWVNIPKEDILHFCKVVHV